MTYPRFVSLLCLLLLTGCASITDYDQPTVVPEKRIALNANNTVGQTFVIRHGGLSGIELWLAAEPGTQGQLSLHLRSDPQADTDLAVTTRPIAEINVAGFHRFSLPGAGHAHNAYRYAYLALEGNGTIWVGAAPGEAYVDGSAYQDHKPIDAQLAFRLSYQPDGLIVGLASAAGEWIGLLAVALLLCVVPGYALLYLLFPSRPDSPDQQVAPSLWTSPWPARLGIAIGVSLAVYPLLLLWSHVLGVRPGVFYVWGPAILGLLFLAWRHRRWRPAHIQQTLTGWMRSPAFWPDVTYMLISIFILAGRLFVIRTLDAPLWGDSYQHAVISQLMLDHGGLFESWEPYAPYQGLTVHYGFSAIVALLAGATGMDATRATLLTGQLLNAAAVLTLYPLAARLANGNRWAGVGAVLVAGLLSPMPAYYVNWGRFAQLAGQVVLPVALWWLWEAAEKRAIKRASLLAALTLSGMTLHYYRMPLYYVTFVLAWMVGWAVPILRLDRQRWIRAMTSLILTALLGAGLLMPLVPRLAGGSLAGKLEAGVVSETARALDRIVADYRVWLEVTSFVPLPLLAITLLALLLSLWRRRWPVAACGLWIIALSSLVAARLIRLPGANLMQNFAVLIALYLPVGFIVGWLLGETVRALDQFTARLLPKPIGQSMAALAFCVAGIAGLRDQAHIVNPNYILVTRPDIRAMAWIREHTPDDARFLVEGFRIYAGRSVVGADAGWWIPLLARRDNTMPPQYALLNETPIHPSHSERLVELVAHLEAHLPSSPAGLRRLCEWGITHVYIGQGQGKVGSGATQLFAPADFADASEFETIYHQDRVWVFALNPASCTSVP